MPLVFVDVEKASQRTKGMLSRRLLEVRAGVFVGMLSKRSIEQMWDAVCEDKAGVALIVYPEKNEMGFALKATGQHRYCIVDNHGLPLISYTKITREFHGND
jgi:CRISPR-associated protein Cas2